VLSVLAVVEASITLSVHYTAILCQKDEARITISSLWAATRTLVYRDKISCPWVRGFPSHEGVKKGYPL